MAGRRDQYQSYRFLTRRHAAALLRAAPDDGDAPLRTLSNGTLGGVVVGVLAMAAAGVFGLLSPGSAPSWQNGKSLIAARDTGTRYLYLGGRLHPVLNYASALLALRSGTHLAPVAVNRSDLDKVALGAPVGIPGAPDSVPTAGAVLGGPWTVCSDPGSTASGGSDPAVRLRLGASGGGTVLGSGQALLVRDPATDEFLVWNGTRLRISGSYVLTALGYTSDTPLAVGAAWENAVPQGPDLAAPEPPGIGDPGPQLHGQATRVGEVLQVPTGTGTSYYVVESGGLAPVTALQEQLLLADPQIAQRAYPNGPVAALAATPADVQAAGTVASEPANATGLPATAPGIASLGSGVPSACATLVSGAQGTVRVSLRAATDSGGSGAVGSAGTEPTDQNGVPRASSVLVPAGHGALVRVGSGSGSGSGSDTLYLVDDLGIKYPLSGSTVAADLGLSGVSPAQLPPAFGALLPTGPVLSESAASAEQPASPSGTASPS